MTKVSMKDIAESLGISRPTVSLILNGHADKLRISEETVSKVFAEAEKQGYVRNELARSVRRGRTDVIAFVGGGGTSYVMEILEGMNRALQENSYTLKLMIPDEQTTISDLIRQCREQMVSGIVCRALSDLELAELKEASLKYDIPVVQADNSFAAPWCGRVVSDDVSGSLQAVRHLVSQGVRKIGFMGASEKKGYVNLRRKGFLEGMKEASLKFPSSMELKIPQSVAWNEELCSHVADYILKNKPEALVCSSDPFAMKVLAAISSCGLKIPEDILVSGYGNLEYCEFSNPPLTTVAQPFRRIGYEAALLILNHIKHGTDYRQDILLPVELIIRKSSCKTI